MRYFCSGRGVLTHALEAYCCGNGYLVYGSPSRRQGSKLVHLEGEHVAAGLHRGIIDGTLWRSVQERLNARGGSTNRGTGHTRGYRGWQSAGCAAHAAMPAATAKGQPTPILSAAANGRASAPALPDCGRKRWNKQ